MPVFQDQDFERMAARAVDRFMCGSKLADATTQEAMGGALSPDQIERLVQAANTMAFLRLMEQQRAQSGGAGPDMTREFDPVDTRHIIQQIMGHVPMPHMDAATPSEGPAHVQLMDAGMPLPNEHDPERDGDGDGKTDDDEDGDDDDNDGPFPGPMDEHDPERDGDGDGKTDDDEDGDDDDNDGPFPMDTRIPRKPKQKKDPPKKAPKDKAKEAAFQERRRHKLADIFEDMYRQSEWAFEDGLAHITRRLKVAHQATDLATFEKDALSLDGSDLGVVVQNMVREARGWPPLSTDVARTKHAALVDRHCIVETDVTRAFEHLLKIATQASRLKQGAEWLRSQCT